MKDCITKLGQFKVQKISGDKNGRAYEFYTVERAFKNEQTGEWQQESISLRPVEMFAVGCLLRMAGEELARKAAREQNARNADKGGADY